MSRPSGGRSLPFTVGRYEALELLGRGGMAEVFLGRPSDAPSDRVAIKLVRELLRNETLDADLLAEARLARHIRDENVIATLDAGMSPVGAYIVMEHVAGVSLDTLLYPTSATPQVVVAVAMRVLLDALRGLHAAHEACGNDGNPLALVHRDFTPQNILVGLDGRAKLGDFGIAIARTRTRITRSGLVRGKLGYMAPEHAAGAATGRLADLWSAGVIAWEIVARRRLFAVVRDRGAAMALLGEPAPPLTVADPTVDPGVARVVARALEPDPARRHTTAEELRLDLEAALERARIPIASPAEVASLVRSLRVDLGFAVPAGLPVPRRTQDSRSRGRSLFRMVAWMSMAFVGSLVLSVVVEECRVRQAAPSPNTVSQ